jgi:hypothetical protein
MGQAQSGTNGRNGRDGKGINSTSFDPVAKTFTINYNDGSTSVLPNITTGEKGPIGPIGPIGSEGIPGNITNATSEEFLKKHTMWCGANGSICALPNSNVAIGEVGNQMVLNASNGVQIPGGLYSNVGNNASDNGFSFTTGYGSISASYMGKDGKQDPAQVNTFSRDGLNIRHGNVNVGPGVVVNSKGIVIGQGIGAPLSIPTNGLVQDSSMGNWTGPFHLRSKDNNHCLSGNNSKYADCTTDVNKEWYWESTRGMLYNAANSKCIQIDSNNNATWATCNFGDNTQMFTRKDGGLFQSQTSPSNCLNTNGWSSSCDLNGNDQVRWMYPA